MVKRIRPARHYQRDDDPILRLSRSAMKGVARDLQHAFNNLSDMVPVGKVIDALKHGINPAMLINWHHYREVLRGPFDRLGKLRAAGGALGARKINGLFAAKRRKVRFKKRFQSSVEWGGLATKKQANYRTQEQQWKPGRLGRRADYPRCDTCSMYAETFDGSEGRGGNCTAVAGRIMADDVCDFFEDREPTVAKLLKITKATGDQFNFDAFAPDIAKEIRDEQDRLIAQLETDARDAIDTIISDGVSEGLDMEEVAASVRDMIGLTDTQAQAVLNYQSMLQDLDPKALQRQLRNTEYDAVYQDAIDAGNDLSDAAVESMVSDYIENYLDYRAATIAQTESTRAANLGLHDAYSQAVDRGAIPEDALTRQWQLGDSPCPICESIPDNNPDGVGIDEPFDSDDGPIDDPPVHPNCECSVDYVTDLTMVPDDSESESEYEYQTQT
jgi:hypothetical protein